VCINEILLMCVLLLLIIILMCNDIININDNVCVILIIMCINNNI